ncbi:glycosyl hydrolase [Massilia sp. Root418]|jgi:alpha-glucosidase (family GH31 glycosyl hydrolase)|uniref:TIM-barrel domain-containing protein n=1 Tax=Massilia sp. Root418 TaxID=1736532 RepID=UPI000700B9A1|nr:TIM-barrel domain-containing protein [Massilia sp. Root418]KQW96604.1 glycosyl hydrolase [Massilia sp. Root418]
MKRLSPVLGWACLLASAPLLAAPIGNLRSIATGSGQQWELVTDTGAVVQLSLPRADVVRIWAAPKGAGLTGAGDKAAAIVVATPDAQVRHSVSEQPGHILISTDALAMRIDRKPLRFTLFRAGDSAPLWSELQPLELGAKQTVQTLSTDKSERFFGGGQQNGRYEFKGKQLQVSYSGGWEEGDRPSPAPFLMSSRGWGVLRNTWSDGSYDLRQNEQISLEHAEARFDAYYFVGKSLRDVLARYTEWTGRARMLPRWALEYGDADCYNDGDNVKKPGTVPKDWSDGPTGKTPDVVESVARRYREHDMPGGWILPNDGYGCGYTNLPETVQGLAKYGFRTGLWTENGVEKMAWEVGTAGTRAQKLDVAWTGKGYQFSLDANKSAYDGILNNSDGRPFIWTVMGWAGTQRYAVTWTGDQSASWDYIRWHIPTLIGSGLSGQAYATGDVDAIFGGSPETYTRDLQWKAFTPVLMGMSGWAAAERKHPWWFGEPYRSINRRYLKLKLRLTPYMYTLMREAEQSGAPLVRGLMWDNPADPAAYTEAHKYQFLLGRDVLVAPVYRSQAVSAGWRKAIHLPQGQWFDYWDGRQATAGAAGRDIDLQVALDKLPVFVRAGAILPMYPEVLFDGEKPKDQLTLDLYPHGESAFTLYEDDGNSRKYQEGAFSEQVIRMQAVAGEVRVEIGAVNGSYAGQEARRSYALRVLARRMPAGVQFAAGGAAGTPARTLPALPDRAAFDAAAEGWYFDAADRLGTLHVKVAKQDIRQPLAFSVQGAAGARAAAGAPSAVEAQAAAVVSLARADDEFPAAPATGRALTADAMMVLNRPAEETGHPMENAFDGKPETWFRTPRSPAMQGGPHEWVIGFTERRLIDGIELAPRTGEHWKHGQIRDYEVYIGDNNGDWGAPIKRGQLKLQQGVQAISFPPAAGRLLRFRVLSTQNPEGDAAASTDPMVTAVQAGDAARAFNAAVPSEVAPITLSEFRVMEHQLPDGPELQRYLSDLALPKTVSLDKPAGKPASQAGEMRMNGLRFRKGLGVGPSSRIDLQLGGNWKLLRADLGVDDSCRSAGGLQFQVWSGERLLYDSGLVNAPAVVKPEIDVRGLSQVSLRTLGARGARPAQVCGNWANAVLIGTEGATVQPR